MWIFFYDFLQNISVPLTWVIYTSSIHTWSIQRLTDFLVWTGLGLWIFHFKWFHIFFNKVIQSFYSCLKFSFPSPVLWGEVCHWVSHFSLLVLPQFEIFIDSISTFFPWICFFISFYVCVFMDFINGYFHILFKDF